MVDKGHKVYKNKLSARRLKCSIWTNYTDISLKFLNKLQTYPN